MTGEPTYIELGVDDPRRARAFFGELLGWPAADADGDGTGQVNSPTLDIGIHGGDPSSIFEVFFAVDDLPGALETVIRLGGNVLGDVQDSGPFGTWAECADDQGTRFGLRQKR